MNSTLLGTLTVASLLAPAGLFAQTLTQHWRMDDPTLTFTGGAAPITNQVGGGSAAAVNNANEANLALWPAAGLSGATSSTGTAIGLRTIFQRIQLGNISPGTNPFTISLWFKRDGTGAAGPQNDIISANQGQTGRWNLSTSGMSGSTYNLDWFHNGGTGAFTFATGLETGQWYHVAITRATGSNEMRWYLNGQLLRTATDAAALTQGATGVWLGRRPAFGTTGFLGSFDDFRMYDAPLSQAGIISLVGDSDNDGLPDVWEIANFILPGEDAVADAATILNRHDGASNADDDESDNLTEFNAGTNPNLGDTDGDGLKDHVENNTGTWSSATSTGTNPLKPDSDGDGLLDGQENNSGTYVGPTDTGTNPNLADSDADTFSDYLEIARGSDPVNAGSTPAASSATPVVSLNANSLPLGPLSSWVNGGTIGNAFEADSAPVVETIGGVKGVTFFGGEVMTGPVAPPSITGGTPRTIQAWIFNPSSSTEETIVAWGRRDGPNGTSNAFFHGTHPTFGAVGNWGTPDMAWGPDAAAINNNVKLGSWTYVVYTYDGGSSNVGTLYSNGTLANTKLLGVLNTWAVDNTPAARPLPIRIAGQNAANGSIATTGQKGNLTLARLAIHDRVLPAAELGFSDSDSDGMLDWYEDFYGLDKLVNDANNDADSDGLSNLQEQSAGTNPSIADTDGDGMPDGWEFDNFGNQAANPFEDADNDGSANLDEYQATRGLLIVRDSNGQVTARTPFPGSSNPNDPNSQPDMDDDNLPDGWEFFFLRNLFATPIDDSDLDSFSNDVEFLAGSDPGDPLSTPSDTDADGLTDEWELANFGILSQTSTGDPDGDGADNLSELTGGSDPNDPNSQPDNDNDGLPDGDEFTYFGDLDQDETTDFDGDGFSDLIEFTAGSNPARSGNTPENFDDTVTVAVATSLGLDQYSVTSDVWTFDRRILEGDTTASVFHQGNFYVTRPTSVVKVDPVSGTTLTLATVNAGDALTAGWILSAPRGIEIGPDGKIYFSTAFGTPSGEGVFRLNTDGSGFERFLARSTAEYDLANAIDLAWKGNDTVYVTARGGFDATNRPIYEFDAAGNFVRTLTNTLRGPQGLLVDGDTLWVTGTNAATALVSLDTTATAPVAPGVIRSGVATNPDVVEILGELHVATFSGSIRKDVFKPALATVLASVGGIANDLTVFTLPDGPDYNAWATGFGLNPESPQGAPTGDFDGDSTTNEIEFALGLDPTSGSSRFAISTHGSQATGLTLTWPSVEGIPFQVRSSSDLSDWSTLEATVIGAVGETTASWTAPAATTSKRFYRVEFTP